MIQVVVALASPGRKRQMITEARRSRDALEVKKASMVPVKEVGVGKGEESKSRSRIQTEGSGASVLRFACGASVAAKLR